MKTMVGLMKMAMALATRTRCKSKTDSKYSRSVSDKELCRFIVEDILDHRADFLDVGLLHSRCNLIIGFSLA